MNTTKATLLFAAITLCTAVLAQEQNQRNPTRIRIGETIFTLQSPLRVQSDTLTSGIGIFTPKRVHFQPIRYPRHSEQTYIGFGFAVPIRNHDYLPIHSGNSFHLQIGHRVFYHPSKYYAIGTFLQYSCYSYRMDGSSKIFMDATPEGVISKECFRTDNIGSGVVQHIRLFKHTQLEAIVYGDWAYSKRYVVKSRINDHKEKTKYRDDVKFNPFGAGIQAGIQYRNTTLYARYRLTNFFNPDYIPAEVTRLSIGISFGLKE